MPLAGRSSILLNLNVWEKPLPWRFRLAIKIKLHCLQKKKFLNGEVKVQKTKDYLSQQFLLF
jgi:hypothetical protein